MFRTSQSLFKSVWREFSAPRLNLAGTLCWNDVVYYDDGHGLKNELDLYVPDEKVVSFPRGRLPVLIWVHGGAWRIGSKGSRSSTQFCHQCCVQHGIVTVPIQYRLGSAVWPHNLHDVDHAIEWVLKNVERFGGDPDNLFVGGHSAGAFLALHAVSNPSVKGVLGISGVYDLHHLAKHVVGAHHILDPLFGSDLKEPPPCATLVQSKKLLSFMGKILLLFAENELPLVKGDAMAIWKSPRQAKCSIAEIENADHLSILESQETYDYVGKLIKQDNIY